MGSSRCHPRSLPWAIALLLPVSLLGTVLVGSPADATPPERHVEANGRVTDIRFWSFGDAIRIAVQLDSSDFHVRSDRLDHPDRLFFDIVGIKPPADYKGLETIPVNGQLVRQIRVAETQPGVTRIVLDLERAADYTTSQLANPTRLMIELRNPDSKGPMLTRSTVGGMRTFLPPDALASPVAVARIALPDPPGIQIGNVRMPEPEFRWPRTLVPPPPPVPVRRADAGRISPTGSATVVKPTAPVATARVTPPAPSGTPISELETATPAKSTSTGTQSMIRVLGLKLGKVVIDPGHGGHDEGTRGPTGLLEKDLVLDVAMRLGALIQARLGSEVIYTRTDDTFVPLHERTDIANEHKADLFISIHANSSPIRSISGVETYYLNFTTSRSALAVAERENASSDASIYDLKDLLAKIALKDKIEESREFASKVQRSLYLASVKADPRSRNRGVRKAPFVVLIGAQMPSILAEIGFISNPRDEALLKKSSYRQKIAEALYKGVAQYAEGLSHFQVAQKTE
jgi:N-acetylmuramoyl-L-alanine amidase